VGELRCADGSQLDVIPVPARDRDGTPYEITLRLTRDGDAFGSVGERCGYFLATLARRLEDARRAGSPQARAWPDEDDRFPDPPLQAALRTCDAGRLLPREPELFAFRHRDRGDLETDGELRCALRTSSAWLHGRAAHGGGWRLSRRAVVEAWGAGGGGVRAVLTSAELARFLDALVREARQAGADYRDVLVSSSVCAPQSPSPAIIAGDGTA
jgi:hypothetical protein